MNRIDLQGLKDLRNADSLMNEVGPRKLRYRSRKGSKPAVTKCETRGNPRSPCCVKKIWKPAVNRQRHVIPGLPDLAQGSLPGSPVLAELCRPGNVRTVQPPMIDLVGVGYFRMFF